LVTNNDKWAQAARMFANHGRTKKYEHDIEGVNSRLDALQAAILKVKLRHIDQWTESRQRNAYRYNAALESAGVGTPEELGNVRAVYHLYVVRVPAGRRDQFQEALKAAAIDTGIHYPIALPYLNAYRYLRHSETDFPNALRASREIVSLPMFPELTEEQTDYVAKHVKEALS
jgi:dTDP-4-amino-4,6-dideoxygalactose transaminase